MKKSLSLLTIAAMVAVTTLGSTALVAHGEDSATGNSASGNSAPVVAAAPAPAGRELTPQEQWVLEQEIKEAQYNATVAAAAQDAIAVQDTFVMNDRNGNSVKIAGPGVSSMRVSADTAQVSVPGAAVTATVPKTDGEDALRDYAMLVNPAPEKVISPVQIQMFVGGAAVTDNFGTLTVKAEVGRMYNGRSAKVYQAADAPNVTEYQTVVTGGYVLFPMTHTGSVAIVIE